MKSLNTYTTSLGERVDASLSKANTRLREPSSWALPKQASSIAPEYVWANAGMVSPARPLSSTNVDNKQIKIQCHLTSGHG
jgi:hypothetical protein